MYDASGRGDTEVVRELITAKADLEWEHHQRNETPLLRAARDGHTAIVRLLLDAGSNREARDGYRRTAVEVSATDTICAMIMGEAGVDVHISEIRARIKRKLEELSEEEQQLKHWQTLRDEALS